MRKNLVAPRTAAQLPLLVFVTTGLTKAAVVRVELFAAEYAFRHAYIEHNFII